MLHVQVVLAPHVYCPAVTQDPRCFEGESRWSALDVSFGYLTVSPGFCSGSTCKVRLLQHKEHCQIQCLQHIVASLEAYWQQTSVPHNPPSRILQHRNCNLALASSSCQEHNIYGLMQPLPIAITKKYRCHKKPASTQVAKMSVQVFAAILDEFGSTLGDANEVACLQSIQLYAAGDASTGTKHATITSWFFW